MPDVPPENIVAMFEAVSEFNRVISIIKNQQK